MKTSEFSALLRGFIKRAGMQAQSLAERCEVNPASVSRWLQGKSVPDPDKVDAIRQALKLPLHEAIDLFRLAHRGEMWDEVYTLTQAQKEEATEVAGGIVRVSYFSAWPAAAQSISVAAKINTETISVMCKKSEGCGACVVLVAASLQEYPYRVKAKDELLICDKAAPRHGDLVALLEKKDVTVAELHVAPGLSCLLNRKREPIIFSGELPGNVLGKIVRVSREP